MNTKEAFSKLAMMCSRKEYCISDIRKKMQNWKLNSNQQQEIINQLLSEKFIDEQRYTEAFVKDKFNFNKWGRHKITYQLKQKQISDFNIEIALESISQEDYLSTIEQLVRAKDKTTKAKSSYERKGKLMRFMAQRGFELDAVNPVIDKITAAE